MTYLPSSLANIQQMIHEIRGQKVMFDFDLAELYEVGTKVLNQAVKRNKLRFPEDFMFQLTQTEWNEMRSQFVTASQKKRNIRVTPNAFTEHGVTMLASVLRSDRAVKMNIAIVRAFIALRQTLLQHKELAEKLEQLRSEVSQRLGIHDAQLNSIYSAIENLLQEKEAAKSWAERERIGFNQ